MLLKINIYYIITQIYINGYSKLKFSKDFFKFIEADSYENIIRMMGQELEEKGYGKKGYTDLIFEKIFRKE